MVEVEVVKEIPKPGGQSYQVGEILTVNPGLAIKWGNEGLARYAGQLPTQADRRVTGAPETREE
ncbi:MAG: hypothetical protein AAF916_12735 [Planctomycetota bacterium]